MVQKKYTLITGASCGLGREFAVECARRGMNLILISLPHEELLDLGEQLSADYSVRVVCREADLTDLHRLEELISEIMKQYSVDVLINNAGVGGTMFFEQATVEYLDRMIQLNIRATTLITRLLIPMLVSQPNAYILNVSSLATFSPVPFKTIYPASKAFIFHFTRGLHAELKDTGVHACVLTPGPILTNHDVVKRINGQSFYVKLSIMSPERIAAIAIDKMLRGKHTIIPGFMNRFNAFVIRMVPISWRIRVGTAIFKRDFRKKKTGS